MHKMCVLNLLGRAANQQVLSFSALQEKLDLDENSFEEFTIDGVKSKLVHPKINQTNRKVVIKSTCCWSLNKKEWEEIHEKLSKINYTELIWASITSSVCFLSSQSTFQFSIHGQTVAIYFRFKILVRCHENTIVVKSWNIEISSFIFLWIWIFWVEHQLSVVLIIKGYLP